LTTPVSMFDAQLFECVNCNLCGAPYKNADILYKAIECKIPKNIDEFKSIYSSSSKKIFYEQVLKCKECGLIYISPRPKSDLIVGGYTQAIDNDYVSQEKGRFVTFSQAVKQLKKLVPKGNLLDIGAASGIFVKVACDAGYNACGVEPSKWLSQYGREKYGVNIYQGIMEGAKFAENSFDIITMWDVLEHVPDPMSVLREAKRIIKPGGYLFINYPRIDDPLAKVFKRSWWFLLSVHLYYFTPKTLKAYLSKNGFEILSHSPHIQTLAYPYLVERLGEYSKLLAKIASVPLSVPGIKNMLIPYFASQYLIIARCNK